MKIAEPRIPRLREELGNLILSIGSKTARDHRLGILIKHLGSEATRDHRLGAQKRIGSACVKATGSECRKQQAWECEATGSDAESNRLGCYSVD